MKKIKTLLMVFVLSFFLAALSGCSAKSADNYEERKVLSYASAESVKTDTLHTDAAQTNPANDGPINKGDDMAKETAVFETTKGNIEIQLYRDNAPITVENFVNYVNSGFFNGTIFHRVIPNFMIQGGGFTPDGKQKKTNAPIKLESNNNLKNKAGTVAMARTSVPDSATAQFFINVVDNPSLDYKPGNPGYAVFGKVVYGMDVVNEIRDVETGTNGMHADWPIEDVIIKSAYMKK